MGLRRRCVPGDAERAHLAAVLNEVGLSRESVTSATPS